MLMAPFRLALLYTRQAKKKTQIFSDASLGGLPLELIERILLYLHPAAAVSLSLTCRRLWFDIDVDYDRDLTRCAKYAIMGYLEQDSFPQRPLASSRTFFSRLSSSLIPRFFMGGKNSQEQKKRKEGGHPTIGQLYGCALCKTRHNAEMFEQSGLSGGVGSLGRGMLQHKPSQRFCSKNYYTFIRCKYKQDQSHWVSVSLLPFQLLMQSIQIVPNICHLT